MIVGLRAVKTAVGRKMENRTEITLGERFAATIDWWRDAGVDYEFSDEIEPLLCDVGELQQAPIEKPAEKRVHAVPEQEPAIRPADLPQDLAAFRTWWVGPDNPFASGHTPKIAPIGKDNAPIMVLTTMPEAEDRDGLLSGQQGKLVGNILRAMGLDPKMAYLASALPCHMTLPDWSQLGTDGLGTVVTHHIALAKPQRVLLFGSKLPALLGHDAEAAPESFSAIANIAALATFSPDRLLDHARQRARLWKRLCQWTASA